MNKIVLLGVILALVVSMATAGVGSVLVVAKESSESDGNGGGGSSSESGSGSNNGGGSSSGGSNDGVGDSSGNNDNDGDRGSVEEARPKEPVTTTTTTPTTKEPDVTAGQGIDEKTGLPLVPIQPANGNENKDKPTGRSKPIDFNCHFHPDDCKPDVPGECPGGFASNDNGNCHPVGPCPPGFGRHDDDESGKCFRDGGNHDPGNFCRSHDCGHDHKQKTIVKVVHKTKVIHKKDLVSIPTVFVPGVGLVEPFNCKLNENNGKIGCEFIIVKVIN